jgi:hypothetical protein
MLNSDLESIEGELNLISIEGKTDEFKMQNLSALALCHIAKSIQEVVEEMSGKLIDITDAVNGLDHDA